LGKINFLLHSMRTFQKLSLILMLTVVAGLGLQVAGQCSPAPRSSGTTFAYGVTDSVMPGLALPQPYIVCDNATLVYHGNNPDTVYLEGSAVLHVQTCANLVVYMRNNSQLRCDPVSLFRSFTHVIYDNTFTSFVDTAGSTFSNFTVCTAMAYDYSAFPGGQSPCSAATAVTAATPDGFLETYPNPARDVLHVQTPMAWQGRSSMQLLALDGRQLLAQDFMAKLDIDVRSLPAGSYLLRVSQGRQAVSRMVTVQ